MKITCFGIITLLMVTSSPAATLADLDEHLDAQRGGEWLEADQRLGTNAAFCRSRWGDDLGRREDCEKEHAGRQEAMRVNVLSGEAGMACVGRPQVAEVSVRACLEKFQSAR